MLVADVLYKRGFSPPSLRCLTPDKADYVMKEVHKGVGVRKPLRGAIIGPQAHMSGVLLAYNVEGCLILHEGI